MPLKLIVKGKDLLSNDQDSHLNGSQLKIDQCQKLPSKKVIWNRKRIQEKHSLL
jgi:hypothetical protein